MVKNPNDLLKKLTEEEKIKLKDLEKFIDGALERASLTQLRSGVSVDSKGVYPGGRVYAKIKEMYENAGWIVGFFGDQRDGDYLTFKVNKHLQEDSDKIRPAYLR